MKTTLSNKLALLVLLVQLCFASPLLAQFELGLQAGRNYLESDAQCFAHTKFTSASWTGGAFGIFGRYLFNDRRLGARLNYAYLPLMFDERRISNIPAHLTRAFSGTNKASDLSFELEWHPYRLKKFHPYLFAGLGAQFANYNVNFNEVNQPPYLKALIAKDKTLPTTNFILPVGLGLQWRVSEKWALHLESSLRMPLSDYYDGIHFAGNPDSKDWFGYSMLGLTYKFKTEPDTDKDGITDKNDVCPTVPGLKIFKGCPDTDGDGIADSEDRCPNLAGSALNKGCPDKDGDGVVDIDDECPDVKGLSSLKGCPDRDGDGIADSADDCPDQKGLIALKGCPDADGDGIRDQDDLCPTEKGIASLGGCPDADSDGIADRDDRCPNEAGPASNKGCPIADADKDGVPDAEDKCPNVAGVASNNGCPVGYSANPVVVAPSGTGTTIPSEKGTTTPSTTGTTPSKTGTTIPSTTRSTPSSNQACAACATSTDPIFNSRCANPKKLSRLGTNPEFGNSHSLSPEEFYNKLKKAHQTNKVDRVFLDRIYKSMGYTGFADAKPEQFSSVTLPMGASGNLGYSPLHKTGCYTLPDAESDRMAFRIEAANGCVIHFMKTCGNHFFFCQ